MVTLTLKDMQFFKANFTDTIHITVDDVKEAGRLLGCNPVYKGFEHKTEAEMYAALCEAMFATEARIFECSELPKYWVAHK
jgi:hypothetical protein